MKKIAKFLSVLLSLAIALSCMGMFASAAGEGYLTLRVYDGFAVVTSCLSTAIGEIDIPATYNGVEVTQIANSAFSGCTRITKITIPSSITKVGNSAFSNCDKLENVIFEGDTCTFGTEVFYNCRSIKELSLPANTKNISQRMFNGCSSLKDFVIPATVTSIGNEAFGLCGSLKEFTIPSTVTFIGKNAFIGCNSVSAFNVASGNTVYSSSNGVLYGPDPTLGKKALLQYPNAKSGTSYVVLSGTKVIADYAFGDNETLTKVTLPSGLEILDNFAFFKCNKLSDIQLPSTVTKLGSQSFGRCESLKTITIPANVETFESAFYMSSVETVVIQNGVKEIGTKSFENCTKLTSVTIPASITKIGIGAFKGCTSLRNFSVPSTVMTIERGAFTDCENITLFVDRDSAAHTYAVENSIKCKINGEGDKTVKSVSVLALPTKTSYNYKETLDTTGLKLSVTYIDGSTETVTSGYEVNTSTLNKTGNQVIDVTYEGCTAQFSVNVSYTWWQWIIMILLLGIFWY